jgi:hypothetical protein
VTNQEVWQYEITPGLQAGVALSRLRFYLAALEEAGINIPSSAMGGRGQGDRVRRHYRQDDDADLRALVDAKWEAIEAAKASASAAAAQAAGAGASAKAPAVQVVNTTSNKAVPALDVAAAPALLPSAAQRAIDARRRNDEEALILLLLEA